MDHAIVPTYLLKLKTICYSQLFVSRRELVTVILAPEITNILTDKVAVVRADKVVMCFLMKWLLYWLLR